MIHYLTSPRLLDISGDCSLCESGNKPLTIRLIHGLIKNNKATKQEQLTSRFKGKAPPGRIKKQVRRLSKYKHKLVIISTSPGVINSHDNQ